MQKRSRLRQDFRGRLSRLRFLLSCAICTIALAALLAVHVFPSSRVPSIADARLLPKQQEIGYQVSSELSWMQEFSLQLSKLPSHSQKLNGASGIADYAKLWKPPHKRDFVPCIEPSDNFSAPAESRGYLLVHTNGGLNQMRAGISDMVAVARIINATLVIPELDKRSFWQDTSNFSDVFDEEYFISALVHDVKVVKKLPKYLATSTKAVKHFRSWSGVDYYQDEISHLWDEYQFSGQRLCTYGVLEVLFGTNHMYRRTFAHWWSGDANSYYPSWCVGCILSPGPFSLAAPQYRHY